MPKSQRPLDGMWVPASLFASLRPKISALISHDKNILTHLKVRAVPGLIL